MKIMCQPADLSDAEKKITVDNSSKHRKNVLDDRFQSLILTLYIFIMRGTHALVDLSYS